MERPSANVRVVGRVLHQAGHDGDPRARTWMPGTRPGMTVMGWCVTCGVVRRFKARAWNGRRQTSWAGPVPAIHVLVRRRQGRGCPARRPGMTVMEWCVHDSFFASIFPHYPSCPGETTKLCFAPTSRPSTSPVVRHASGALHYLPCHFIYRAIYTGPSGPGAARGPGNVEPRNLVPDGTSRGFRYCGSWSAWDVCVCPHCSDISSLFRSCWEAGTLACSG